MVSPSSYLTAKKFRIWLRNRPNSSNWKRSGGVKGFDFYNPGPLWTSKGLKDHAIFVRNPVGNFYSIDAKNQLTMTLKDAALYERTNPAFICQRITSWYFTATTNVAFQPENPKQFAGLALFQNETHYIQFGKTMDSTTQKPALLLESFKRGKSLSRYMTVLPEKAAKSKLSLKVEALKPDAYAFSYSLDLGKTWKLVGEPLDATMLSTEIATGFQGAELGIYATNKLYR